MSAPAEPWPANLPHVVVVDDDPDIRALLQSYLGTPSACSRHGAISAASSLVTSTFIAKFGTARSAASRRTPLSMLAGWSAAAPLASSAW